MDQFVDASMLNETRPQNCALHIYAVQTKHFLEPWDSVTRPHITNTEPH